MNWELDFRCNPLEGKLLPGCLRFSKFWSSSEQGASLTSAFTTWFSATGCHLLFWISSYTWCFEDIPNMFFMFTLEVGEDSLFDVVVRSPKTILCWLMVIGYPLPPHPRIHWNPLVLEFRAFFSWVVGWLTISTAYWRGEKSSAGFELRPVDGRAEYFLTKNSKAARTSGIGGCPGSETLGS